jgi:probable F420-dependent oxidoreductase
MVKFGVSIPTGREGLMVPSSFASKGTLIDAGVLAEELGFHSVWGNDHITVQEYIKPISPKPAFYSPLITMAALASVTEGIKLGTGIFVLPWRTPSMVICAKQIATLDVLSGGRLLLGVGTGAYREESQALGIDDNLRRMHEGVEALRNLFNTDPSSYYGNHVRFEEVEFYPKPLQKPFPLYLGRHLTHDRVLRWIAAYAQGWIPGLYPEQFAESIPRLKGFLKEYGRSIEDIDIVREISLRYSETRGKALEEYLKTPAQAHMRSLSKEKVDFQEESKYSLIGTTRDIIEGIESYVEVGVDHFMFNFAVRAEKDLFEGMERFAEEIMPSFN